MNRVRRAIVAVGSTAFVPGIVVSDASAARPKPVRATDRLVRYREVDVRGLRIFYREAGPRDAPVLLLLHGFPSSSHMYRALIPALCDRYRLIAPDYPGFGYSDFPDRAAFDYSFARLAEVMHAFTETLGLQRYGMYIQDYGAPVGLRLALLAPHKVSVLITQNGNAYEEGLSQEWAPLRDYWADPTPARREKLRGWLTEEGVRSQYAAGLRNEQIEALSPDTWTIDWARLQRPGNIDMQLDLFGDYRHNIALYPRFHDYFRRYQPATLIAWGKNDPFFTTAGARAFKRDLPKAELHLLDTSHFALETHAGEIAALMHGFLARHLRA